MAVDVWNINTERLVTIHFHPLRDAPALKPTRFKITSTQPFSAVVSFLRKRLRLKESEGVWCYVGNFSPSPDEGVGGLYNVGPLPKLCFPSESYHSFWIQLTSLLQCFKTGEELKVGYSISPTFG